MSLTSIYLWAAIILGVIIWWGIYSFINKNFIIKYHSYPMMIVLIICLLGVEAFLIYSCCVKLPVWNIIERTPDAGVGKDIEIIPPIKLHNNEKDGPVIIIPQPKIIDTPPAEKIVEPEIELTDQLPNDELNNQIEIVPDNQFEELPIEEIPEPPELIEV